MAFLSFRAKAHTGTPSGYRVAGLALSNLALSIFWVSANAQQPIYQSKEYSLWRDHVISGNSTARVLSPAEIDVNSTSVSGGAQSLRWVLEDDISAFPQMRSDIPLVDALYNMSLGELRKDTREDGAFNAGANWDGVWTRDVSYSILLSLAAIQPDASKASLLHKVRNSRIVQDTGTGGSWPVSSDRVTWALAACEVYLTTGDKQWLQQSFDVIRNTIRDDEAVVMDPITGLAHGETTFLDWREQTYPRWMEPIDIYDAEALGTNAVYYRTYCILAEMGKELGQPSQEWSQKANKIRTSINRLLWMKDKGMYGEYLYGRSWFNVSPRSDALSGSLTILFDIADAPQQDQILMNQPLLPYGVPTVFPYAPNVPAYHNRAVWPFVQAFWNLAAAKRENGDALTYGLASMYRAAAIFLTNKENFLSDTGSQEGTVLNSDRQLWSVAGNLAMTYHLLFGMNFATDGVYFQPVVPELLTGKRLLTGFHYRNATLNIEVRGFGSNVRAVAMDGKRGLPFIPADATGNHTIIIELDNRPLKSAKLNLTKGVTALETPQVRHDGTAIAWKAVKGATLYQIYRNGVAGDTTAQTTFSTGQANSYLSEFEVKALGEVGTESFLSAPIDFGETVKVPITSGALQYVSLDLSGHTGLQVESDIAATARYRITFHFANGSGPINTDNKCAIRTLFVDGKEVGPVILPQRGLKAWSDWGSNPSTVNLSAGKHTFELRMLPQDRNMNVTINEARVDSIELIAEAP